jgi:D-alanyl-D-alanine-carboxypeptidase/D-alanyl-D-alanine-endopeptidase
MSRLSTFLLFLVSVHSHAADSWQTQADHLASDYLNKRTNCALVIGMVCGSNSCVRAFGHLDGDKKPDAETLFEIGSITKVFTAILLELMAEEGSLKLDDHADKYLPEGVKLPERDGRAITLLDLATHSSGLPRLPGNLKLLDNPYAHYSAKDLYDGLRATSLKRKPGEDFEYSNFGFGVLGRVLELRAHKPYEELVREKLLRPLGMSNTVIMLSAEHRTKLAPGHDHKGRPTGNWDFDALAGAGAFRSNASDMMKFLRANLAPTSTALASALPVAQKTHFRNSKGARIGLGWHRLEKDGLKLAWHNGGTGGYVSFLGLDPQQQIGVVLLSNYGDALANDWSSEKLALDLLKLLSRAENRL